MPNQSAAHTALVNAAIEALALRGYTAWKTAAGAMRNEDGYFMKYGKKGAGDITGILPPNGRHFEAEAKTGGGAQNKNQKLHQQFVVERNGGLYILFHTLDELFSGLAAAGH